jgi:hypothetical protein
LNRVENLYSFLMSEDPVLVLGIKSAARKKVLPHEIEPVKALGWKRFLRTLRRVLKAGSFGIYFLKIIKFLD